VRTIKTKNPAMTGAPRVPAQKAHGVINRDGENDNLDWFTPVLPRNVRRLPPVNPGCR